MVHSTHVMGIKTVDLEIQNGKSHFVAIFSGGYMTLAYTEEPGIGDNLSILLNPLLMQHRVFGSEDLL